LCWADGKGKMWPRASLSCAFKYRTPTSNNHIPTFPAPPNFVLILLQFSMVRGWPEAYKSIQAVVDDVEEERRTSEGVCVEAGDPT